MVVSLFVCMNEIGIPRYRGTAHFVLQKPSANLCGSFNNPLSSVNIKACVM